MNIYYFSSNGFIRRRTSQAFDDGSSIFWLYSRRNCTTYRDRLNRLQKEVCLSLDNTECIKLIRHIRRNLPEGMAKEQNRRKSSIFTIFAQKQTLGITVLTDVERRDDNISYKSGSVDNITASTAHILNERTNQSISETMFSNKLPGISTISC